MTPHTEVTADVATRQAIERFNDAVNRRDVDAVVAAMTEDCVFDCTQPPDGERYHGADQMRAFLVRLFATARERHFDVEGAGDEILALRRAAGGGTWTAKQAAAAGPLR